MFYVEGVNIYTEHVSPTKGCAEAARILWLKIEFACYYCLKCHKNQACSIILAWVNYKVAKNCLKVGKITILSRGISWRSALVVSGRQSRSGRSRSLFKTNIY